MKKKPVSEREGSFSTYIGLRLDKEIVKYYQEQAKKRKQTASVYIKNLLIVNYMKHNNVDNMEAFEILKHHVGDKIKVFDKDINKYRPAIVTYIDYSTQGFESRYLY